MPKKFINVSEIIRNGRKIYRARLTFPFDEDLGYRPAPIDFYGATAQEADRKRREYKPEKSTLDRNTSFVEYVSKTFLPQQEAIAKAGKVSWAHYTRRKSNLTRYLLEPADARLVSVSLRKVRLGALKPAHVEDYFAQIDAVEITEESHHRLKDDFRAILRMAKHKIPNDPREYLDEVKVPALPKRIKPLKLYDSDDIFRVIGDSTKPLADRAFVAFLFITQCRPQEMYALEWSDIDLKNGSVNFFKRLKRAAGGGFAVQAGTKTGAKGVRHNAAMGAFLTGIMRELKKQVDSELPVITCAKCGKLENYHWHGERTMKVTKRRSKKHPFEMGTAKPKTTFVFTSVSGLQLSPDAAQRRWSRVKKSLNLPDGPRFYNFKHAGHSYARSEGVSAEAQAAKMGHSSTKMGEQVYREILNAEKVQSVSIFDKKLGVK